MIRTRDTGTDFLSPLGYSSDTGNIHRNGLKALKRPLHKRQKSDDKIVAENKFLRFHSFLKMR